MDNMVVKRFCGKHSSDMKASDHTALFDLCLPALIKNSALGLEH